MDDLSPPAGPTLLTGGSGGVDAARPRRPAAQRTTSYSPPTPSRPSDRCGSSCTGFVPAVDHTSDSVTSTQRQRSTT